MTSASSTQRILSIDIGGSTIKAILLDHQGNIVHEFQKLKTPKPSTPAAVLATIQQLTKDFPRYHKVSVGFPGYVKKGRVYTAPNLGTRSWKNIQLDNMLEDILHKPVRVVNDADLAGLGVVRGEGLELVITLGTGFGTALLQDGQLLPHLEMAHHPVTKSKTYDQYIGKAEFKRIGVAAWNKRVKAILQILKTVFNYDRIYIGGGNASELDVPPNEEMIFVNNKDGIKGGARLWQLDEKNAKKPNARTALKKKTASKKT